jgi:DNA polymerase theta
MENKSLLFKGILSDSFIKVDGFIGNSSPHGGFQSVDMAICTIEKANSLMNRLIEEETIFEVSVIVVDELHMVNDSSRGYLLELILSKIKYLCIKNQTYIFFKFVYSVI